MDDDALNAQAASLLRSLLDERLKHNEIVDLTVCQDVDHDGDPIFRIRVVTSDEPVRDGKRLTDVLTQMRTHLPPDSPFPRIYYMSKAGAAQVDAETV